MKKAIGKKPNSTPLRRRAEDCLQNKQSSGPPPDEPDLKKLVHELEVHQIELEMQNEELKRAQSEIEQSREKYRELYDFAPVGYFTVNDKGLILRANLMASTMSGVTRDKLVKRSLASFIFREDQEIYYRLCKQLLEIGNPQKCELRIVRRDGSQFWVKLETIMYQDVDLGSVSWNVMTNITDIKEAEEVLQKEKNYLERMVDERTEVLSESEKRYRNIFENALEGIYEISTKRQAITLNSSMAKMLGYDSPADAISSTGNNVNKVWADMKECTDYFELLEKEDVIHRFECRFLRKDGTECWVSLSAKRISGPDGKTLYYSGFGEDVTERMVIKQLLEDRLKFETMLADLSAQFINMQAGQLNTVIENAQRKVCEYLDIDVCALWQQSTLKSETLRLTHICHPPDFPLVPVFMDSTKTFPWCLEKIRNKESVILSRVTDAPAAAARDIEVWQYYGIKSSLTLPISIRGGEIFGALSFNTIRNERHWPIDFVKKLEHVVQIFANAIIRDQADLALRESEEHLRLASIAAAMGLWAVNLETGQIWATAKVRELFHFAPDLELNYVSFFEKVHPEDCKEMKQCMKQACQSGESFQIKHRTVLPDGSIRWILHRGQYIYRKTGEVNRLMGASVDITDRKLAEIAMKESAERFQQVAESVTDFIWEVDKNGLFTYTNQAVERILGYSPDELIGKMHYYDLFVPEAREESKTATFGVFDRKESFRKFPNVNIHKNGNLVYLETTGGPMLDSDGNLLGYRGADSDITQQKKAEQEIKLQRNQLVHLSRVSTMGQLASSLAHELNQPLGAILRNSEAAELILQDPLPDFDEVRAILADICKDDHRAGDVINRMRGLLKRNELELCPLSINKLVDEIISLVKLDADIHEVRLESQTDSSVLPPVYGDLVQLQQVLLNLLVNAVDAVKNNPRENRLITMKTRYKGTTVEIAVSDTGTGIPEQNLSRVFEPFFSSKPEGLGMGLAISRLIVEAHDGRLWVENNAAGGATFTLALPVTKSSGQRPGGGGWLIMAGDLSEPELTPVVRIVDDDDSFLTAIARLLRASGFAVKTYTSATEFLARPESEVPGCVLVDLQMPDLSGLDLQEELAKQGHMLPVVFLTGHGDIPTTVRAMRLGAEDFLTKLSPKKDLLDAVKRALKRDARERAERSWLKTLRARFAELTPREHEVMREVVQGRLNKQIAYNLGIQERTVKFHRTSIMTKLCVHSVPELMKLWIEAGKGREEGWE